MSNNEMQNRLALHTWTLDTTPLAEVLRIVRKTEWNAVELRRIDFTRALAAGMTNDQFLDLVLSSGVKVATLGVEPGCLFAKGDERRRLFSGFTETCANAVALGCDLLMTAPGPAIGGTLREAAASLREMGEIAKAHDLRLAVEFSSGHDVVNRLEAARELLALAGHPNCGLLLDAYHLERSGAGGRGFDDVPARDIFAFQYSDVPAAAPTGERRPIDRLPPGQGVVRWHELFQLLQEKNYAGYLSYEAPNPAQWARPAEEVAREGVKATRNLLAAI